MTAARTSLAVLAALAAGFFWLAIFSLPASGWSARLVSMLGGALVAAPVLVLVAPAGTLSARLADGVLAGAPPLGAALILAGPAATSGALERLGFWPLAIAGLAAGLALLAREMRPGDAIAPIFPLGAAAFVAGLSAVAAMGGPAAVFVATPVHIALGLLAVVVLAGLALAMARRSLPPAKARFLRAMIGLLPLLGFTGTILGIMRALQSLPDLFDDGGVPEAALSALLAGLATAFETTLIGLVAAVVAGFLLTLIEATLPRDGP